MSQWLGGPCITVDIDSAYVMKAGEAGWRLTGVPCFFMSFLSKCARNRTLIYSAFTLKRS